MPKTRTCKYRTDCGRVRPTFVFDRPKGRKYRCDHCRKIDDQQAHTVEITMNDIRRKRNRLLSETDFVDLPSFRKNKSEEYLKAWDKYRDKLRDLTSCNQVKKIVFPEKPQLES